MKKEIVISHAEAKVIKEINEVVRAALLDSRYISYRDLRKYCIELGLDNPPNTLTIPVPVLDKCLEVVKEEWGL